MALKRLTAYLEWIGPLPASARRNELIHGVFAYMLAEAEICEHLRRSAKLRAATQAKVAAFLAAQENGAYAPVLMELQAYLAAGTAAVGGRQRAVRYRTRCIAELAASYAASSAAETQYQARIEALRATPPPGPVRRRVLRLYGG